MNFKIKIVFSFLAVVLVFGFWSLVSGKSEKDIAFPVAELGNCGNKTECKSYCNEPSNMKACIAFAKEHKLMSGKEAKRAEKVAALEDKKGPGGCQGFEECKSFCDNADNTLTCIEFAKTQGLMDDDELKEAEKVANALRKGAKLPGNCGSKEKCEAYCDDDFHMNECIEFAHTAGFMNDKEYEMAKKTGGKGPGGCRGKSCEKYCDDGAHFEECIAFAEENGMISQKEAQMAKKTGGKGPGGCRGKECKDYCEKPENFETCLEFGKEQGFMSEKEYEMAKKTGGKGPGGCKGEGECKNYCEDPANREECMNFAKEHGLMPEGEMGPPAGGGGDGGGIMPPNGEMMRREFEERMKGEPNNERFDEERMRREQEGRGKMEGEMRPPVGGFGEGARGEEPLQFEGQMPPSENMQNMPPVMQFPQYEEVAPPPPPIQSESPLNNFGATLMYTLQFLMGR